VVVVVVVSVVASPFCPGRGRDLCGRLLEELPRCFWVLLRLGQRIHIALLLAVLLIQAVGVVLLARAVEHCLGVDGLQDVPFLEDIE